MKRIKHWSGYEICEACWTIADKAAGEELHCTNEGTCADILEAWREGYLAAMNFQDLEWHKDMDLPVGMTCDDCVWLTRCVWLLQRDGDEMRCDWSPSRFKEKENG